MKISHFNLGVFYFMLMIILEMILPEWVGDENGIIENLQLLWLVAGFIYCFNAKKYYYKNWQGKANSLCNAGMIYFFLLFMREISWGRTFIHNPDGGMIQYSQMGIYGKLVHPTVGILIFAMVILLYRARVWRMLCKITFPTKSFILLLTFIFASWVGEKANFTGFHGQVAEELAEFGAYMMMFFLLHDTLDDLKIGKIKQTEKRHLTSSDFTKTNYLTH